MKLRSWLDFISSVAPPPSSLDTCGSVASRSQSCSKIIKLFRNTVQAAARCPGGENKSIRAADESNPSSSEGSRGSARRASAPAAHYRSIPPKSRHILAPNRGSVSGLPVPGTADASEVQIQLRRDLEKLDIATVSFSSAPNFRFPGD